MSLDLYQSETLERIEQMPAVQEPEVGAFQGFWRGAGLTTMKNLARAGRSVDMAGAVGPILQDAVTGGTELQDRYFKEHDDVWGSAVDYWTPRPNEVGVAGQITGELLTLLPMVIASPSFAVGATQLGTAEDLVQKGVDADKAQAVGAVQGAGLGLGIWMPILGQNLWQRVVVGGAGFNLGQGIVMRGASGQILEGTPAAKDFQAFDGEALTLDVLLGAAFGGVVHMSPKAREQGAAAWERIGAWAEGLTPTQKSALVALRLAQHLNVDSAPGLPASAADVESHVSRVRTAIEQIERGQPVEVTGITEPRFEAEPSRLEAMMSRAEEMTERAPRLAKAEGIPTPHESPLDITYDRGLNPEMAMVQSRIARQILADVPGAMKAYDKLPGTDGGKILNTDLARELSPDYAASLQSRARYTAAVHEPVSALVKAIYAKKLAEPDPNKLNMVTFTAGGTGAGKTGAITGTQLASKISQVSQIVYDTNMNTTKSSIEKIDQAIAAGKQVSILWVGRDPVEALKGAIKRAVKIGRTVPLTEHAKTHVGSAATVERLVEHYQGNSNVQFVFLDNAGAKGEVTVAGPELPRSYNFDNLEVRLKEALDAEYKTGAVPDHVYQGFAGHEPGEARAVPGRAGEGQPPGEHASAPRHRKGIDREELPREEVGPDRPPAPGEKFLVFRLGATPELANRNAGNADAVARFIMGTEDPMGPIASKAGKVFAYEVSLEEGQPGFGKYEGLTGASDKGPKFTLEKKKAGDGVRHEIMVDGKKVGSIGGFEVKGHPKGDFFELSATEVLEASRGTGVYQRALQKVANEYPQGVRSEGYQSSPALKKALAKMPTFERVGDDLWIRPGKEATTPPGRVARGTEVAYSFREGGYKAKLLGERSLDLLRTKLKNAGFESFDDAGSNAGARAIREAFTESEAPPAKLGGSEPPPPRGSRPGEAGGAEDIDPLRGAADQMVEANPERQVRIGTNADGSPMVRSAKDYLKEVRDAVKQAKTDSALFEAAAQCLLGRA